MISALAEDEAAVADAAADACADDSAGAEDDAVAAGAALPHAVRDSAINELSIARYILFFIDKSPFGSYNQ